jgi:hypothetical protein
MDNLFWRTIKKLEGKTIEEIRDNSSEAAGSEIVIMCTDKTQIAIHCFDNDLIAKSYGSLCASKRHLYNPVIKDYDLYIHSTEDDRVLRKVGNEEVIHGMEYLDKEGLYDELEMSYSDILEELGLMNS